MQRLCMSIVIIEKPRRGETRGASNISVGVEPLQSPNDSNRRGHLPPSKMVLESEPEFTTTQTQRATSPGGCPSLSQGGSPSLTGLSPRESPHLGWGERRSESPKCKTLRHSQNPGVPNSGAPRAAQVSVGSAGTLGAHPSRAGRGGLGSRGPRSRGAGSGTRWGGSALAHLAAATSCKGSK